MIGQLTLHSTRNGATVGNVNGAAIFQSFGVGGQDQQVFDPENKCFDDQCILRGHIESKAMRDDNLLHVQRHGKLPALAHKLESGIADKKASLSAKRDEHIRELQEVECGLGGNQFLKELVRGLEVNQIEGNRAFALKLIADTETSLAAKKDGLLREIDAIDRGLSGIQVLEGHLLELKQMQRSWAMVHGTRAN